MAFFRKSKQYDRVRILDDAKRARDRRRRKRAIELYRWVLAVEPKNGEIHARIAPLLADTRQPFDAWNSYKTAARMYLRDRRPERTIAVYRDAALRLPREVQTWQALARLLNKRGQGEEAVDSLLEGSRHFRSRSRRPQAIHLLRRARSIDPWCFDVVLELSRLLALSSQRHEAEVLLAGLAQRFGGSRLRRVRSAQFRLAPGPLTLWRWLRAIVSRGDETATESMPAKRSPVIPLHAARRN